eukprot:TRINITY_DN1658_c0_g1_i3.p1 TRINITY_DN1658_c0_g1~~TRINITY_DN1658_c0_g1_i3.p1  ORF type:complete len:818 (+),score=193.41 TRINITY_DN1658_c0_g1_i3:2-2455(+)
MEAILYPLNRPLLKDPNAILTSHGTYHTLLSSSPVEDPHPHFFYIIKQNTHTRNESEFSSLDSKFSDLSIHDNNDGDSIEKGDIQRMKESDSLMGSKGSLDGVIDQISRLDIGGGVRMKEHDGDSIEKGDIQRMKESDSLMDLKGSLDGVIDQMSRLDIGGGVDGGVGDVLDGYGEGFDCERVYFYLNANYDFTVDDKYSHVFGAGEFTLPKLHYPVNDLFDEDIFFEKNTVEVHCVSVSELREWDKVTVYVDYVDESIVPSEHFLREQLMKRMLKTENCFDLELKNCIRKVVSIVCTGNTLIGIVSACTPIVISIKKPDISDNVYVSDLDFTKDIEQHIKFMVKVSLLESVDYFRDMFPQRLLLHGIQGCGKKTLIKNIAKMFGVECVSISPADIMNLFHKQDSSLMYYLNLAIRKQPCILLFEDMEFIFSRDMNSLLPTEKLFQKEVKNISDILNHQYKILMIGTSSSVDTLNSSIRNIFQEEKEMGLPTKADRKKILQELCSENHSFDLDQLADNSHGNSVSDLILFSEKFNLTKEKSLFLKSNSVQIDGDVNMFEMEEMKPKRMININSLIEFNPYVPDIQWNKIFGQNTVKKRLLRICKTWENSERLEALGGRAVSGVLLYGGSGSGKTLLAKALAAQAGYNCISISAKDIIQSELGESEKKIALLFKKAKECAPCIILFDQIHTLFGSRSDSNEFGKKLIAQFQIELDGVSDRKGVVVIGTTVNPESVDNSFLRPGRFDEIIEIPLPDKEERMEILLHLFQKYNASTEMIENSLLDELSDILTEMTFGELDNMCYQASIAAQSSDSQVSIV